MVSKCVENNCVRGYKIGERKSFFHFPEGKDLNKKWIYFENRKICLPSKDSVICIGHLVK